MSAARNCKSPTFCTFRRKHILLPIDGYKIKFVKKAHATFSVGCHAFSIKKIMPVATHKQKWRQQNRHVNEKIFQNDNANEHMDRSFEKLHEINVNKLKEINHWQKFWGHFTPKVTLNDVKSANSQQESSAFHSLAVAALHVGRCIFRSRWSTSLLQTYRCWHVCWISCRDMAASLVTS